MASIPLYLGESHPCSYLHGKMARMAVLPPDYPLTQRFYAALVRAGFRRSGELVYRTYCEGCVDCIPIRIPVKRFSPNRAQRRVWAKNQGLAVKEVPARFSEEHYRLYQKYQSQRHPDSDMAESSAEEFIQFLGNRRFDGTVFYEFRRESTLVAVSVVDVLDDGFSAVYTFFDPKMKSEGLGVFAVLWLIEALRAQGLASLYLGFWIRESQKMAYKSLYRPHEILLAEGWQDGLSGS